MIEEAISKVEAKENLSEHEASAVLAEIFDGKVSEENIVKFLSGLAIKGETVSELLGFVRHLSSRSVKVHGMQNAVDTCGTGGSGRERFNVGTTVAFVLAAGGYPVAKHGNYGSKKRNGSFDLLEAMGVNFDLTAEQEEDIFSRTNLCFLFARKHHPLMKIVGPARAKLESRSIFNLIGPLCNPADVNYQVVGVSNITNGEKIIEVLKQLGRKRAIVVCGFPGIDEFSISGESTYWLLNEKGDIAKHVVDPSLIGMQLRDYGTMPNGDSIANKDFFEKLINGNSCHGLLDMIALNAGAAIHVLGKSVSIFDGYDTAKELILSGEVKDFYEKYKSISNQYL